MGRDVYIDVIITGANDKFNPSDHEWGQCDSTFRCKQKDGQWKVSYDVGGGNPAPFLTKISSKFPEVIFDVYYWGIGEGFAGELTYKAGVCTKDLQFVGDEYETYFASNYYMRPATPEEVAELQLTQHHK